MAGAMVDADYVILDVFEIFQDTDETKRIHQHVKETHDWIFIISAYEQWHLASDVNAGNHLEDLEIINMMNNLVKFDKHGICLYKLRDPQVARFYSNRALDYGWVSSIKEIYACDKKLVIISFEN
jgi:hypothetical protein